MLEKPVVGGPPLTQSVSKKTTVATARRVIGVPACGLEKNPNAGGRTAPFATPCVWGNLCGPVFARVVESGVNQKLITLIMHVLLRLRGFVVGATASCGKFDSRPTVR